MIESVCTLFTSIFILILATLEQKLRNEHEEKRSLNDRIMKLEQKNEGKIFQK